MIDENLMEEINEAAARGKDTLAQSAVSLREVVDGLRAHNKWRRDGSGPLPVNPMRLGELIDGACDMLERYEKALRHCGCKGAGEALAHLPNGAGNDH